MRVGTAEKGGKGKVLGIHAIRRAKPQKKASASRNHLSFARQGTSHLCGVPHQGRSGNNYAREIRNNSKLRH